MRIITLKRNYKSCLYNSYLLLGPPNRINVCNTVVDPGPDASILDEMDQISPTCCKLSISQVILTHDRSNHINGAMALKERYNARTFAVTNGPGIDELLQDGQFIDAGGDILEVLHTPGCSPDAICLYAPTEQALFSGDMRLQPGNPGKISSSSYIDSLLKIACRDILTIYSSHDEPVMRGSQGLILQLLDSIRQNSFVV